MSRESAQCGNAYQEHWDNGGGVGARAVNKIKDLVGHGPKQDAVDQGETSHISKPLDEGAHLHPGAQIGGHDQAPSAPASSAFVDSGSGSHGFVERGAAHDGAAKPTSGSGRIVETVKQGVASIPTHAASIGGVV